MNQTKCDYCKGEVTESEYFPHCSRDCAFADIEREKAEEPGFCKDCGSILYEDSLWTIDGEFCNDICYGFYLERQASIAMDFQYEDNDDEDYNHNQENDDETSGPSVSA